MSRVRPPVDWERQALRSLLFAPGNHARRLERVGEFGSDVIVLDLEDAVANAEKIAARVPTRAALSTYTGSVVVTVRVNGESTRLQEGDIEAVLSPDLDCLMVPKVESVETLVRVSALLDRLERDAGIPEGQIRLLPIVETAVGLVRCEELALSAPPRVVMTGRITDGKVEFHKVEIEAGSDSVERSLEESEMVYSSWLEYIEDNY